MTKSEMEAYLIELDHALAQAFPDPRPIQVMMVGGAFLVLMGIIQRHTDDIDVVITDLEGTGEASLVYQLNKTTRRIRKIIETIGKQHGLKGMHRMWLNDDCAPFLIDMGPLPAVRLWRAYQKLHLYVPTDLGYILSCKLMAGRIQKDYPDIAVLRAQLGIQTREQAQALVDRFFPDKEKQRFQELPQTLDDLFGRHG